MSETETAPPKTTTPAAEGRGRGAGEGRGRGGRGRGRGKGKGRGRGRGEGRGEGRGRGAGRGKGPSEGKGGEDGHCVTLHNLSYDTKRYDLKEHVKTVLDGGFGRVDLQTKPDGTSTGRARVGFRFLKDAEAAAKALDGSELDGRNLSARVAPPRRERPAGKGL